MHQSQVWLSGSLSFMGDWPTLGALPLGVCWYAPCCPAVRLLKSSRYSWSPNRRRGDSRNHRAGRGATSVTGVWFNSRAHGNRVPVRPWRLRSWIQLIQLFETPAGGLHQDRRQLHQEHGQWPSWSGHGEIDRPSRQGGWQTDYCGICPRCRNTDDIAWTGCWLRPGISYRQASRHAALRAVGFWQLTAERYWAAGLPGRIYSGLRQMNPYQIRWDDNKSLFAIWTETALPSTTHWLEWAFRIPPYGFLLFANPLYEP